MYFKLNNIEYMIEACSVAFDIAAHNQKLKMFIDIHARNNSDDVEYELQYVRLYHNNGFEIGAKTLNRLKGKKFVWDKEYNKKDEEAGTMYVLEHENLTSGKIEILDVTKEIIKIKWTGLANVFWDEEFDENVPFETEIEAELPEIPKTMVLNGMKKKTLVIDKETELEVLNFEDLLNETHRCTEMWRNNDREAWNKYNATLNLKLTHKGVEYQGKAVYAGSPRLCELSFCEECPKVIKIDKTTIDTTNGEYNFYISCK